GRSIGPGSEVPRVHDAVLVDDEGHDPGDVVLSRPGNEREPAGHLALDDVALGSAWRGGPLRGQDLEVVAVQRRGLTATTDWTPFFRRLSDQVTQRASFLPFFRWPVETVLLARIALELHCVPANWLAIVSLLGVALLRSDVCASSRDCLQFVAPD